MTCKFLHLKYLQKLPFVFKGKGDPKKAQQHPHTDC